MTTLAEVHRLPGLDSYLEQVESRLAAAVASYSGRVAEVGSDALASGGKRLRPLLAFLSANPDRPAPVAAGVAVELVHMATLVHDDLIDGARIRRGKTAAWAAHGPEAARATGDYLFSRAFAELAADGDVRPVAVLAEASLCLARGEAMQRRQRHDPDTPVEAYLERCALKTGKLFEAACSLGSGGTLGRFGLNLGNGFQHIQIRHKIVASFIDMHGGAHPQFGQFGLVETSLPHHHRERRFGHPVFGAVHMRIMRPQALAPLIGKNIFRHKRLPLLADYSQ